MNNFRDIMVARQYGAFVSVAELPGELAAKAQELRAGEEDDFLVTVSKERGVQLVSLTPARSLLHLVVCAGGAERINWGAMPRVVTF